MKKRLLIVDDDVDVLESLKLLLETSFEVCLSRNGAEALREMDSGFHPDAILLDLGMPEMDGAGFLGELKRRGDRVPVLIVSAHPDAENRGHDLGVAEVLRKPFTYEQLREKLDRAMRGSGGGTRIGGRFLATLLLAVPRALLTGSLNTNRTDG
jgi:DNA-binding response OmpR family regulator